MSGRRRNAQSRLTRLSASLSPEFQRPSRITRSSTVASRQTVTPTPTPEPLFPEPGKPVDQERRRITRASARRAHTSSSTTVAATTSPSVLGGNSAGTAKMAVNTSNVGSTPTGRKRSSLAPDDNVGDGGNGDVVTVVDLIYPGPPATRSKNVGNMASAPGSNANAGSRSRPATSATSSTLADAVGSPHINGILNTSSNTSSNKSMEPPAKRQRTAGLEDDSVETYEHARTTRQPVSAQQNKRRAQQTQSQSAIHAPSTLMSARGFRISTTPFRTPPNMGEVEEIDLTEVDDDAGINVLLRKKQEELLKSQKAPEEEKRKLSNFKCVICLDDPTDLAATPCGHMFCNFCLLGALKAGQPPNSRHGRCPVCRRKVMHKDVVVLEIKKLRVKGKGKADEGDVGLEKEKGKAKGKAKAK